MLHNLRDKILLKFQRVSFASFEIFKLRLLLGKSMNNKMLKNVTIVTHINKKNNNKHISEII